MREDISQIRLTLSRLNGMWSFTAHPLSYQVDLLLRIEPTDPVENLVYAIRGYGCLARLAGNYIESGVNPTAEWNRLFAQCGQRLMFDLPESLKYFDKRRFQKQAANAFMFGFKTGGTPPPPGSIPPPPGMYVSQVGEIIGVLG